MEVPINKYSTFELKGKLDQEIANYFIDEDFYEIEQYSNIKILFGFLACCCTAIAYLYPLPFPQNYYIIIFSLIGYVIFSNLYWYIDKKVINTVFFIGVNENFFKKLRPNNSKKIIGMKIHSEIDDKNIKKKHIYKLWFELIFEDGSEVLTDVSEINCTRVYDEKGYSHGDKISKIMKKIVKSKISKI